MPAADKDKQYLVPDSMLVNIGKAIRSQLDPQNINSRKYTITEMPEKMRLCTSYPAYECSFESGFIATILENTLNIITVKQSNYSPENSLTVTFSDGSSRNAYKINNKYVLINKDSNREVSSISSSNSEYGYVTVSEASIVEYSLGG